MSISSSLSAGVSGLNANSQRLATISDNIANSSTNGYKRAITDFHSVVVGDSPSKYTAGGVRTSNMRLIDERGQLQGSGNSTDISIDGRGFLPVTNVADVNSGDELSFGLTTTGSFRPDDEGILVDPAGRVLLGWPANADGTVPNFPRDSMDGLEPVNVNHNEYAAARTTDVSFGVNLPADDSNPATLGGPSEISIEYFGNLGQTESLSFEFTPTGTANEWNLVVTDSESGGVVGDFDLQFSDAATGGGTLTAVASNMGTYDPVAGTLALNVGGGPMEVDIGTYGDTAGLTQLDASFGPTNISKNGAAVGSLVGVEIDERGMVNGIYNSGYTRPIYQVPVVDVPNPNGLTAEDNQTFRVSPDSGPMFLWDSGSGPVGATTGFTTEASTVDVAQELTDLIQTQRAYSSNAKVIQTVDEMLQETTNLKR